MSENTSIKPTGEPAPLEVVTNLLEVRAASLASINVSIRLLHSENVKSNCLPPIIKLPITG